jgi:septum site-determining protein MinD
MARIVTITSGKGGVGKTTTTANLGAALALADQKVVVFDGDIGLRNLDIVMGLESRIVYDAVDVVEGRCKLRQALIRDKRTANLSLLPTAQARDKSAISPQQMMQICDELAAEFEFILIASPAGIEQGFRNSLAPATEVLIVVNPEVSSVRDADRVIGLIESSNKGPAKLIINRLVPTRVKKQEMLSADDIYEILSTEIIGIVPEDEHILSASNKGQPVSFNGKTPAAEAYRDIAQRMLGKQVPMRVPQENDTLWSRIFGGRQT